MDTGDGSCYQYGVIHNGMIANCVDSQNVCNKSKANTMCWDITGVALDHSKITDHHKVKCKRWVKRNELIFFERFDSILNQK